MFLTLAFRLQPHDLKKQAERGRHNFEDGSLAFWLMVRPMRPLTLLTTVLSELAKSTGAKSHKWHETIWITWVLAVFRPRIVHFETPTAVFCHAKHINNGDDRFTFQNRLSHICALNRPHRHEFALFLAAHSWCRRRGE